jgi:hypothetical protein
LQARRNARVWIITTALLIVLAAGGLVTWQIATRPSPIHIAFANSLSGAVASEGTESLTAAQLYVDEVNHAGGVDGHEIVLDPFDDRSSAKGASDNVQAIADGPALAVLGHLISPFSIAAASGYKAAHIPALTSQSVADELTIGNPWYFRLQTPNTATAEWLALLHSPYPAGTQLAVRARRRHRPGGLERRLRPELQTRLPRGQRWADAENLDLRRRFTACRGRGQGHRGVAGAGARTAYHRSCRLD